MLEGTMRKRYFLFLLISLGLCTHAGIRATAQDDNGRILVNVNLVQLNIAVTDKDSVKDAIVRQCRLVDLTLKTQMAYALATTQWETAQTFKPVKEAYWLSEDWRKANLRYFPYYGRGYVQLTWQDNYKKYGDILTLDLVNNLDMALQHDVALFVLVHGFQTGTFTGRKLTDYVTASQTDFVNARRCINGTDHAQDIANVAQGFMTTL